jgi:hypothetical protein
MRTVSDPSSWNSKSVNESFIYRGKDANLRWKECLANAKHNKAYEAFADEAAAKASVYDYLDGRSFLESRAELVAALRELATLPLPNLAIFDKDRFARNRALIINGLLKEFLEADIRTGK